MLRRREPELGAIVCRPLRRCAGRGRRRGRAGGRRRRSAALPRRALHDQGVDRGGGHAVHRRRGRSARRDGAPRPRPRRPGCWPPARSTLGATNTSELTMWIESDNRVYGRTNNAYDPSRTAGGSSGGEGAVVGAGGSPIGLGSDIGGSIRLPAFFNGVFGHKASSWLVPNSGQFPPAEGDLTRMLAVGPIARRAEDLMPMLRTIAGPDGVDPDTREVQLGDPERCGAARSAGDRERGRLGAAGGAGAARRARAGRGRADGRRRRGAPRVDALDPAGDGVLPGHARRRRRAGRVVARGRRPERPAADAHDRARRLRAAAGDHTLPLLFLLLGEKLQRRARRRRGRARRSRPAARSRARWRA